MKKGPKCLMFVYPRRNRKKLQNCKLGMRKSGFDRSALSTIRMMLDLEVRVSNRMMSEVGNMSLC